MRIAIVGCGYVADLYARSLKRHTERLQLVLATDRQAERAERFCAAHGVERAAGLAEVLADPRVELVVNLTNPRSHYEVSRAALEAGKHVYSEKPLAMDLREAQALVALAEQRGLLLSGAPCSVLGETAQTLWRALREQRIGTPRLVYAELDDGPIHLMPYRKWRSETGAPWPAKDEFEVGCTLEHAGYYVTWLIAFFGPARRMTAFAGSLVADKGIAVDVLTPDFTVACIEFASGLVARLTCSIYAPHDHALRIIGDGGILAIKECWDYGAPVYLQRRSRLDLRFEKHPRAARLVGRGPRRLPLIREPDERFYKRGDNRMDFARGVADMAEALAARRLPRLSARFALHVNEIVLAIQNPAPGVRDFVTTCEPMLPAPWA